LKTSTDVGTKVAINEGFEKRGADYIKTIGNTSDILGFDEKGTPKEKIMSRESGFVIDVPVKPEHAFIRDMEMLGSKITETTSQLKQVEQYSKELELLKGKSPRTENEEKKMQQLESINLKAVKERLTARLETLQERMKKYEKEAQAKPNEMEQYEKTKESQRKKVEFYDAIGLTRFGKHAESLVKTIGQLSDDIFPPKIGDSVGSNKKEQEHFLKVFGLMLGKE
jgi:vacuolar-type H+-ATPase subunit I/STV1